MAPTWIDFWNQETIFTQSQWQKNTAFFLERIKPVLNLQPSDKVLDIGCGPGYLADKIEPLVKTYYGIDPSASYISQAQKRLKKKSAIQFEQLKAGDYTNFHFLPNHSFSKAICLSVIQYYRKKSDLETLLKELERVMKPGGLVLIADIPQQGSVLTDVGGGLKMAWRSGYLVDFIRFLFKARFSPYHRFRRELSLLTYSEPELQQILVRQKRMGTVLTQTLTLNANRIHLLVQY